MPAISEIPSAASLHSQLDALNKAIAAIQDGSNVTNITVSAPSMPPPENGGGPIVFMMPISIILDPPITDPTTLGSLALALQAQADVITGQLVEQGYTDDGGEATTARAASVLPVPPTVSAAPPTVTAPIVPVAESEPPATSGATPDAAAE